MSSSGNCASPHFIRTIILLNCQTARKQLSLLLQTYPSLKTEVLQPIYDSFETYSNNDDDTGAFMDYGVAEVDFAVCSGATTLFGMRGSSYSLSLERIIGGGKTFWYNDGQIHSNYEE